MSEAINRAGLRRDCWEPKAITFAEILRGRASAAGVTPPDVLRPAGGRNAATVTGSSMGASPPAAAVFRLDVTVLLLAALVYGWLWYMGCCDRSIFWL